MAAAVARSEESRLGIMARVLAAEFRRFDFLVCQTREHHSIAALRRDKSVAGVCAVVTDDMAEMRAALAEDGPSG